MYRRCACPALTGLMPVLAPMLLITLVRPAFLQEGSRASCASIAEHCSG